MDLRLESWLILQGWKQCRDQKGNIYYCRFSKPRVGVWENGRVVVGWHDRGTAHTVEELIKILADAKGEEISV